MRTVIVRAGIWVTGIGLLLMGKVGATEWYWINDLGGIWNESFRETTSWRDSLDNPGLPADGDDILMVLPYSMSFPGYTQPVVVNYSSDVPLSLNDLIVCSENWLIQDLGFWATVDQLDLTVENAYIGGYDRTYSPPSSFYLPDTPGIFPIGKAVLREGRLRVNQSLNLGDRLGSSIPAIGTFELEGNGLLEVGEITKFGFSDSNQFIQTGGTHLTNELRIYGGQYSLSDGLLSVVTTLDNEGMIHQSGGTVDVGGILEVWDYYHLENGSLNIDVKSVITCEGRGFLQTGGKHSTPLLEIGLSSNDSQDVGPYTIDGGILDAQRIVFNKDRKRINQNAGIVRTWELGVTGSSFRYEMTGGSLEVGSELFPTGDLGIIDNSVFIQSGPASTVTVFGNLRIGELGWYRISDGSLSVYPEIAFFDENNYIPVFHQSGGTVRTRRLKMMPIAGQYELDGGVLIVADPHDLDVLPDEGVFLERGEDRFPFSDSLRSKININGGTLETDQIFNGGIINWNAGEIVNHTPSVLFLEMVNSGRLNIRTDTPKMLRMNTNNTGRVTLIGDITIEGLFYNNGTLVAEESTVSLILGYTGDGRIIITGTYFDPVSYESNYSSKEPVTKEPSANGSSIHFHSDVELTDNASIETGPGAMIIVEGDFLNSSRATQRWDTSKAHLVLAGEGEKQVSLPGENRGDSMRARVKNFAWDKVEIRAGTHVTFIDGNPNNDGTALYTSILDIQDPAGINTDIGVISAIAGDINLVYDPTRPENAYLEGKDYSFVEGSGGVTTKVEPVAPKITVENNAVNLVFESHSGVSYNILQDISLLPSTTIDTVEGTGVPITYSLPLPEESEVFYRVEAIVPNGAHY